ncbi:uncharacterized protein [Ptychodera flava]|uniref:uncharacterized protein n=1 Tax=Ptychodera flava TaxID=63121 RepID=UPI003969F279
MFPSLVTEMYHGVPTHKLDLPRYATSKNWATCWASARANHVFGNEKSLLGKTEMTKASTKSKKRTVSEVESERKKTVENFKTSTRSLTDPNLSHSQKVGRLIRSDKDIQRVKNLNKVYCNRTYSHQRHDVFLNKFENLQDKVTADSSVKAASESKLSHGSVTKRQQGLSQRNGFHKQKNQKFNSREGVECAPVESTNVDEKGGGVLTNDGKERSYHKKSGHLKPMATDKALKRQKNAKRFNLLLHPKVGTDLVTKVMMSGNMTIPQLLRASEQSNVQRVNHVHTKRKPGHKEVPADPSETATTVDPSGTAVSAVPIDPSGTTVPVDSVGTTAPVDVSGTAAPEDSLENVKKVPLDSSEKAPTETEET